MKRKGYKNIEQQLAADKRYLENNFQTKQRRKVIVAKSSCKRFINELANVKELAANSRCMLHSCPESSSSPFFVRRWRKSDTEFLNAHAVAVDRKSVV